MLTRAPRFDVLVGVAGLVAGFAIADAFMGVTSRSDRLVLPPALSVVSTSPSLAVPFGVVQALASTGMLGLAEMSTPWRLAPSEDGAAFAVGSGSSS